MSKGIVSQKQLEANRSNALSSTGPRTAEGKARSSRNALKHGIFAQEVVIRDGDGAEDPKQFEALLERLWDEFQPVGGLEETLVERIAISHWRLRRAQRFEVGAIRARLDECNEPPMFPKADRVELELEKAKSVLAYELRVLPWAKEQEDLTAPQVWELLVRAWDEVAREHGSDGSEVLDTPRRQQDFLTYLKRKGLAGDQLRQRLLEAQRGVIEHTRGRLEGLETKLLEARRYDKLHQERAALLLALPDESNVNKLIRYETMVNRELDRTLNRLERLQRARQGDHVPAPVALDVNVTGMQDAKEAG